MSETFLELGSIAEFINGAAFKPEDWGETGKKIIRIQNLTDPNKPFNRTERIVSDRVRVQYGDLLVSWSATLGVFEWQDSEEALLNQHIFRVLPNEEKVDKPYLRHGLEGAIVDMQKHLHGATMQHVNRGEFLSTKLYLPKIEEQKRIAKILDRSSSLISKRKEAIAKLDTLTQSIFIEMFGDPVTNPKNIKTLPLAKVCKRITNGTHQPPKWSTSGHPFLFVSNIVSGKISFDTAKFISNETHEELTRRCPIEIDDVLYSTVGSYGVPVIVKTDRKFAFQRHIAHIKPDSNLINSQFLCAMLASPPLKHQADRAARGVAQKTVNLEEIRKFIIFCPSFDVQKEFAQRVEAIEKLKATHHTSLTELQALFASLQHRAFRGEL